MIFALLAQASAGAQPYLGRSVRVVVPAAAGGPTDAIARPVFQQVAASTGQSFVIDARAGGRGTVGAEAVAKSAPDGYTVLVSSETLLRNTHLHNKLPYDVLNDFTGITPLARQSYVMAVHPSLPLKSVKDLIALARARAGAMAYASAGNGTGTHTAMALFNLMTDTRMVHVPYKGAVPAAIALASGEIRVMFGAISGLLPQIQARRVRPLAVSTAARIKQLPEIPTLAESGVAGYELSSWFGCFLPAKAPRTVLEKLNGELKKALASPDVAHKLGNQMFDTWHLTPDEFAKVIRADYDKFGQIANAMGMKAD